MTIFCRFENRHPCSYLVVTMMTMVTIFPGIWQFVLLVRKEKPTGLLENKAAALERGKALHR